MGSKGALQPIEPLRHLVRSSINSGLTTALSSAALRTAESDVIRDMANARRPSYAPIPDEHKAAKPCERLLLDGYGPIPAACIVDGTTYVLSAVCDATGFVW